MAVTRGKAKDFLSARDEALARMGRAPLPGLIVIAGEEAYVKERLIDAAVATAGDVEVFAARPGEGDDAALRRLLDAWTTASLFGGGRLVVARDADALLKRPRSPELAGVEQPPNHLLLTCRTLDGRTRLAKTIKKAGGLFALPPLRDAPPPWHQGGPMLETDLNLWLVDEALRLGVSAPLDVADELSRRVGNEPARLAQTIEILSVLIGERDAIEHEDVARHVRFTSVRVLELFEQAVRAGKLNEALPLLDQMRQQGVLDHTGRLVVGAGVLEVILRGMTTRLARLVTAHDAMTPALQHALVARPWDRSEADGKALDAILGVGGARVFLERDVRSTSGRASTRAFGVALSALRALRDGRGASAGAVTTRLTRAFASAPPAVPSPQRSARGGTGRGRNRRPSKGNAAW